MRIGVIGAGAIGSLVAGYLKDKGKEVSLAGHPLSVKAVKEKGLSISGVRGNFEIKLDISEKLGSACDLAILAVKTQDLDQALRENLGALRDALILTTENGVQADRITLKYLLKEKIISGIVMFGATYLEPGKVAHNFEGSWILGKIFKDNDREVELASAILKEVFPVVVTREIKGMKYLKIFVNAGNCLAAILGLSMQEAFSDLETSRINIAVWQEGLEVIKQAGIKLVSLPDFPLERLTKLTGLAQIQAAKIFFEMMLNLSKEPLYGSVLQSIKRGKASEIDYLNGEFVNIAKINKSQAPLNEKLVEMVHQVERSGKFFSRPELINLTKQFLN